MVQLEEMARVSSMKVYSQMIEARSSPQWELQYGSVYTVQCSAVTNAVYCSCPAFEFRVSGAITLHQLAEQILMPVQNFKCHLYCYKHPCTGAVYGPPISAAHAPLPIPSDVVWKWAHGIWWVSSYEAYLSDVVQTKGDVLWWCYDLGTCYKYRMVVKDVVTHTYVMEDGKPQQPPTNNPPLFTVSSTLFDKILKSVHSQHCCFSVHKAMRSIIVAAPSKVLPTVIPAEASSSPVYDGCHVLKVWDDSNGYCKAAGCRKGVVGLCWSCAGAGIRMFQCSRCHVAWYCSKECQKSDWQLHKQQCSPEYCINWLQH
eukprot:TRINITY_DN18095_c0_g1_i2.p1 TRINITY_DN18095_c0_g1~~TRINITY_DN18095_c0_g1_i2.p1  ORF type:complete len:314 (+),score=47.00 TRINITY_DN18095_c0_g1_i2:274-1215(+)